MIIIVNNDSQILDSFRLHFILLMDDLDDLLDGIEIEGADQEEQETTGPAIDVEAELKSEKYSSWLSTLSGVPADVQRRWSEHVVRDLYGEAGSALQPSDSYRSWDAPSDKTHQTTSKLLHDAVSKACAKCAFDDRRTSALLALTNPQESSSGKALQLAYGKQIIKDLKRLYTTDPNFNTEKFPNLAKASTSKD